MATLLIIIAIIWLAWKMLVLGLKAAWGIAKILCAVIILPAFIFGLVCIGLIYIAIPILVISGVIAVIGGLVAA